jgi:hypothetical protein
MSRIGYQYKIHELDNLEGKLEEDIIVKRFARLIGKYLRDTLWKETIKLNLHYF